MGIIFSFSQLSVPTPPIEYDAVAFDIPHMLSYPEKLFFMKYNGVDILAGGCRLTMGGSGHELPYLIRYRAGIWTEITYLVPGDPANDRRVLYDAVWDGAKWWVCGRDFTDPPGTLFTIDAVDNVVDLSANTPGFGARECMMIDGGGTILIGGESHFGTLSPMIYKMFGGVYTNITAQLQGNPGKIVSIDYRAGTWMVGGWPSSGNQAWLNSWNGVNFTDLSANLPGPSPNKNLIGGISHNALIWVFGLGPLPEMVTYDGFVWTEYTAALPNYGHYGSPLNGIVWSGANWYLYYSEYLAKWNGIATFTDLTSEIPYPPLTNPGVMEPRVMIYIGNKLYWIPESQYSGGPQLTYQGYTLVTT